MTGWHQNDSCDIDSKIRNRRMKTLIFIMTAAGLLYACGTSLREQKPKQYAIAYNVHNPDTTRDDWEIMRMKFDGSEKKNITNNPDVAWTYLAYKDRLFLSATVILVTGVSFCMSAMRMEIISERSAIYNWRTVG